MSGFLWKDSANSGVPCVLLLLLLLLMGWCDTVMMYVGSSQYSTSQVVNSQVVSPRLLYIQPGLNRMKTSTGQVRVPYESNRRVKVDVGCCHTRM